MGNNDTEDKIATYFTNSQNLVVYMESSQLIDYITQREEASGLYDIKIDGISIYNYISRSVQVALMDHYGSGLNYKSPTVSNEERKRSLRKSFKQLARIIIRCKKVDNIIRSFERVDFINGNYVDKFTDPIVDYTDVGRSCLILEHGRAGRHLTPRLHSDLIIYVDFIYWLAWKFISLRKKVFYRKHSKKIDFLFSKIESTFPEIKIDRNSLFTTIVRFCFITKCYNLLFKRIGAKRLFAPGRVGFKHLIPAARMQGLTVYELQHGLVYSKSITYAGYHDPMFTPDYFLSFGKISNAENYGIKPEKLIEIGWGFNHYLKLRKDCVEVIDKGVFVISTPDVSETMVSIVIRFAESFPNIMFSYRPHPLEVLSPETLNKMSQYKNITINDNAENIFVSLAKYNNVLGSNSAAMYDALAMGKKVGKLEMLGLVPEFLDENDRNCFYLVSDEGTFEQFINAPMDDKPSKKNYSDFKPEVANAFLK